jgi:hypothetical protein
MAGCDAPSEAGAAPPSAEPAGGDSALSVRPADELSGFVAWGAQVPRLWLVATNDNVGALRFYVASGMWLVAVHLGAVDREIELALALGGD